MNRNSRQRMALLLSFAALLPVAPLHAQTALAERYAAGSIASTETADRALAETAQARAATEARYAEETQDCQQRFFVTGCIDAARERRRVGLQSLQPIEQEANQFKRRVRAVERDAALRQRQEEEARRQIIDAQANTDAAAAAERKEEERTARLAQPAAPTATAPTGREMEHTERMRRLQAQQATEAAQRAENEAAYRRKAEAAAARQREVAERKAAKERERAANRPPRPQ